MQTERQTQPDRQPDKQTERDCQIVSHKQRNRCRQTRWYINTDRDRQTDIFYMAETNRWAGRQTKPDTDRQIAVDRQANRHMQRQTGSYRQIDGSRQTDRQVYRQVYWFLKYLQNHLQLNCSESSWTPILKQNPLSRLLLSVCVCTSTWVCSLLRCRYRSWWFMTSKVIASFLNPAHAWLLPVYTTTEDQHLFIRLIFFFFCCFCDRTSLPGNREKKIIHSKMDCADFL